MKENVRWGVLSVFHDYESPPNPNEGWSSNTERNFRRLLQAPCWNLNNVHKIDMSKIDAFLVPQWNIAWIDKEVNLCKNLHEAGVKVVTAYSHDLRFLIGNCMINEETGTLYTATCEYADLIISGLPEDLHMFGRYEDKVISFGWPFERIKFTSKPFEQRSIDLLVSSSCGMEALGWTLELLLTLKERFPDKRIVFSIDPAHAHKYLQYSDKLEFVPGGLIPLLCNSKAYLNPELRPRTGRAIHESFMCDTPFISSSLTYYSKLYKDFTYSKMDMIEIGDKYELILNTEYEKLILDSSVVAEGEYWDVQYKRLIERLFSNPR